MAPEASHRSFIRGSSHLVPLLEAFRGMLLHRFSQTVNPGETAAHLLMSA